MESNEEKIKYMTRAHEKMRARRHLHGIPEYPQHQEHVREWANQARMDYYDRRDPASIPWFEWANRLYQGNGYNS